jgi:predicted ATPase
MSMRLHRLEIHNYKSLRNVAIEPTPLSVFVGPNAAGKTNLADAIDFLGHVYAWNLEKAVSGKGGYDSICFRDTRRSGEPISFGVTVEYIVNAPSPQGEVRSLPNILGHSFEFKAVSQGIQAPYVIGSERFVTFRRSLQSEFLRVSRKGKTIEFKYNIKAATPKQQKGIRSLEAYMKEELVNKFQGRDRRSELLLPSIQEGDEFRKVMESLRVFQLDPRSCREAGIPSPNPDLDRSGRNLPIAFDHLKKSFPEQYSAVLETARRIMPSLEAIETDWTHNRALTLFIKERGVRRPWTSEDLAERREETP